MLGYLIDLSNEVEKIYDEMEEAFSTFQKKTGLTCLEGCGKCCTKNGIEATMLEVLPLAVSIWQSGNPIEFLEKVDLFTQEVENGEKVGCYFYNEDTHCRVYSKRATICRSFGAYIRKNRQGQNELALCKVIKEQHKNVLPKISQGPEVTLWSEKIRVLDPNLGRNYYPLYSAVKLMLEKILFYDNFRVMLIHNPSGFQNNG